MGYSPSFVADAGDLIGNPTSSTALPANVPIDSTLSLGGGSMSALPASGTSTTGDYTLQATDWEKSLITTDSGAVTYTLPAGFPSGFVVRSYQGAAGQISYSAGIGATIVNGSPQSGGLDSAGFFADIENLGGDEWIITGVL